jgi:hypothetical protein
MNNRLLQAILAVALFTTSVVRAQEVIDGPRGVYHSFFDANGRITRLEGNGIGVTYLYDSPETRSESGVAARVNEKLTLTVRYHGDDDVSVTGLPKLTIAHDGHGRTSEVRADGKVIATFAYTKRGYVSAVSLPGHFTMQVTGPDAAYRVRQTVVDASGKVLAEPVVLNPPAAAGMWRRMASEVVEDALGFDMRSLSYQIDPTGYLESARDAKGHVVLYLVHVGRATIGFTPAGVARFYDLSTMISDVYQDQAVPMNITLASDGSVGMYIEQPANGAIYAAWVEPDGVTKFIRAKDEDKP